MTVCSRCGAAMGSGERFCAECGGEPKVLAETPEAIARYESAFREFAADNVLEDWEEAELAELRRKLEISMATHNGLLAKYQLLKEALPILLEVDEANLSGFVAGAQGVVRARLRNGGERALRNLVARHVVSGEDAMREHIVRVLGPGKADPFAMVVALPRAGQYLIETVVRVEDMLGNGLCCRAEPLGFQVGQIAGPGPQSISVHIDASAQRVGSWDGLKIGGDITSVGAGGALAESRWRLMPLRPMTPQDWETWARDHDASTRGGAVAHAETKSSERARAAAAAAISGDPKARGGPAAGAPPRSAMASTESARRREPRASAPSQIEQKRKLVDDCADPNQRFQLLLELAGLWANEGAKVGKVTDVLEEALELQPQSESLLNKLLQRYQDASRWSKVLEMHERLVEVERDAESRAKHYYRMGQLILEKEDNPDGAIDYFDKALDLDPKLLKALEATTTICIQRRDWKGVERAYRRMLDRLAGGDGHEVEYNIWHGLGLLYRDRLMQPEAGIDAFERASRLKPEDLVERQVLAEMCVRAGQIDRAAAELQEVVARDPMRIDAYRALYKAYLTARAPDKAWCVTSALVLLDKADSEQRAFFEARRPKSIAQFCARLDPASWDQLVVHPEQDRVIGRIFEVLLPAARMVRLAQLRASRQLPELPRSFLQYPTSTTLPFAQWFFYAAQVLNLAAPVLYVRNDVPGAVTAAPMDPPSSIAGASVLSGFTPMELMFLIGAHLTQYRGEHYLRSLYSSPAELKTLLMSAVKLVSPDFPLPADVATAVDVSAAELGRYLHPTQWDALRIVVKPFLEAGAKAEVERWMQATDMTAARAGLVLCGDLGVAAKMLRAEPNATLGPSHVDKLKALVQYAVGEPYFRVRKVLGIAMS